MLYRVFKSGSQVQIAEIRDPSWPLIQKDESIPLMVNGKEGIYKVTKVGGFNIDADRLVIDLWVDAVFPKT